MQVDAVVILLVLVLGCAAFFFGLFYLALRALAWMGRGMWGTVRPTGKRGTAAGSASRPRVCPRDRCRRLEYRAEARYCGQCGEPLF